MLITSNSLMLAELTFSDSFLSALGRSHIMLVHFPIALCWMAALAELLHRMRSREGRSPTAFACLGVAALFAVFSASAGWLHAEVEPLGSSVEDILFRHRWLGVAAAVGSALAFLCATLSTSSQLAARLYRSLLATTVVLVTVGAHYGGTLVYGPNYLFGGEVKSSSTSAVPGEDEDEPTPDSAVEPESVSDPKLVYTNQIQPLFIERCSECHGSRKQKAGLRLDDLAEHFAEDEIYWVILPGEAERSSLYHRLTLPVDDEDIMPAKGDPLSPAEIALIRDWIDSGAEWVPGLPDDPDSSIPK